MINIHDSPTLINIKFYRNKSVFDTKAIYNKEHSQPNFTNCQFIENDSNNSETMLNDQSNPNIINYKFISNTSRHEKAIYNFDYSSPKIINTLFNNNHDPNTASAIYNRENCTPEIINSTFYNNKKATAIKNVSEVVVATVINSVFHGNGSTEYCTHMNISYSLTICSGFGNLNETPLFSDADGLDGIEGNEDDNLSLMSNSPSIDNGTNDFFPEDISTDLVGNPRFVGDKIDIKTYETSL